MSNTIQDAVGSAKVLVHAGYDLSEIEEKLL